ncbi:hypothetical protein CALVIDRAFT_567674 [Calocera viscosa TUFC12733]|uniref:Uncharacterized protein n=1 Tax=Calocera viscosa (strain TUFC12733) TaxID=1330018 RepID=A0A167HXW2_CALVF|nr:hypothetical protein CALVIDRAFT_567674 [Calocera viscosa TUFC12733]
MLFARSFNLLTLSLVLAVLTVLATPTPAQELTNAERFRRGLPPKAPRRLYDASVADTAKKGRAT